MTKSLEERITRLKEFLTSVKTSYFSYKIPPNSYEFTQKIQDGILIIEDLQAKLKEANEKLKAKTKHYKHLKTL